MGKKPGVIEAHFQLAGDMTSAHDARAFARQFLDDEGLRGQPDLVLLVSELVTNAVLHGQSPVKLVLRRSRESIRVEVVDAGRNIPRLLDPSPTDHHGRGLVLVDALARAWGSEPIEDDGKQVWCEVAIG